MLAATEYIGMDISGAAVDFVVYNEHDPLVWGHRRVAKTTAGMAEAAR